MTPDPVPRIVGIAKRLGEFNGIKMPKLCIATRICEC
jgi:hypothetical protein